MRLSSNSTQMERWHFIIMILVIMNDSDSISNSNDNILLYYHLIVMIYMSG